MAAKQRNQNAPDTPQSTGNDPLGGAMHDSAQQIWQAGLGAFTRAQIDGSKTFEALVKEGVEIQRKTQAAAEERIAQATQHMASLASNFGTGSAAPWDKLGSIFEDRVARALQALGIPSAKDMAALQARVDALAKAVQALGGGTDAAPKAAPRKRAATVKTNRVTKADS